ncbi:MAG: hypothetical protein JO020_23475 [Chloroflexi bacterium]|nr:hypothetical protein [Chloroflexota bacterium]
MPTPILFRLSGASLLLGGLLAAIAMIFHPTDMTDPANVPVHLALYTAVMLIALGLPGLYGRFALQTGRTGLVGIVLLFVGAVFADPIHSVLEFTVVPVIAADPSTRSLLDGPPPGLMGPLMLAIPVLLLGMIVWSVSVIRGKTVPRWPAVMSLAGVAAVMAGMIASGGQPGGSTLSEVGPGILYLSLAAFGLVLVTERKPVPTAEPRVAGRERLAASG